MHRDADVHAARLWTLKFAGAEDMAEVLQECTYCMYKFGCVAVATGHSVKSCARAQADRPACRRCGQAGHITEVCALSAAYTKGAGGGSAGYAKPQVAVLRRTTFRPEASSPAPEHAVTSAKDCSRVKRGKPRARTSD